MTSTRLFERLAVWTFKARSLAAIREYFGNAVSGLALWLRLALGGVVVGAVMKIILVEGADRYTLATGETIFEGWRYLGKWTTYIMIWRVCV